jgi:O-antigen/teichoic acid export membrane protein
VVGLVSKSIFKNALYKVLLSVFNIIVPVIVGPYPLHVLGSELMGRVNFADSIYNYFFIFAGFGIYQYGLREISRIREDKTKLSRLFTSLFMLGLVSSIISLFVFLLVSFTAYRNDNIYPILLIFSFNIFANIFYTEWVNEALEKYDFITVKTVLVRCVYLVLLFTLVRTSRDYLSYVIISSLYLFLNNFLSFLYIKTQIKFDFKQISLRGHIKFLTMGLMLANASILYTQLDRFMLGEFIDKPSVAYYNMSQMLCQMVNGVVLGVIYVTVPRLSNYLGNNNEENYTALLNKVAKAYTAFLYPTAVGIYTLSSEIVHIYGGKDFLPAIPILRIFSVYIIFTGMQSIMVNQVIYVKRQEKALVTYMILWGVVNLFLNIVLLKLGLFNSVTAIASTLLSNGAFAFTQYYYVRVTLKVNLQLFSWDNMKYLLISLLFIPLTSFIRVMTSHNMILTVLISVIAAPLIYFSILILSKDEVINTFLQKLFMKFKRTSEVS